MLLDTYVCNMHVCYWILARTPFRCLAKAMPALFDYVVHSFIHIEHLYSAPSRKLFRGAPDSSTDKKNSFKVSKERGREGPRNKAKLQREAIPGRGTPHRESAILHSGGSSKRDK